MKSKTMSNLNINAIIIHNIEFQPTSLLFVYVFSKNKYIVKINLCTSVWYIYDQHFSIRSMMRWCWEHFRPFFSKYYQLQKSS